MLSAGLFATFFVWETFCRRSKTANASYKLESLQPAKNTNCEWKYRNLVNYQGNSVSFSRSLWVKEKSQEANDDDSELEVLGSSISANISFEFSGSFLNKEMLLHEKISIIFALTEMTILTYNFSFRDFIKDNF